VWTDQQRAEGVFHGYFRHLRGIFDPITKDSGYRGVGTRPGFLFLLADSVIADVSAGWLVSMEVVGYGSGDTITQSINTCPSNANLWTGMLHCTESNYTTKETIQLGIIIIIIKIK